MSHVYQRRIHATPPDLSWQLVSRRVQYDSAFDAPYVSADEWRHRLQLLIQDVKRACLHIHKSSLSAPRTGTTATTISLVEIQHVFHVLDETWATAMECRDRGLLRRLYETLHASSAKLRIL